jgi:hypothetical protein
MEYLRLIKKPSLETEPGIRVTKDLELEYKNENVEQTLKDLTLHTTMKVNGEGFESTYDTTIYLNEGEYLIFEEEGRGYIKPLEEFMTIEEARKELDVDL